MASSKPKADKAKYEDTQTGWAKRWKDEFQAAKKDYDKVCKAGDKVIKVFLVEKRVEDDRSSDSAIPLFYANVTKLQAMLYGQLPKAEVDRTFADANDDVARVASEILERMLNNDIQRAGDDYGTILRTALSDRLLPGLGTARVRYDFKSHITSVAPIHGPASLHPETGEVVPGEVLAEGYDEETIDEEWVDTIYTYWKDIMWSPARTHAEIRWKAFRSYMVKDELEKRFGPKSDSKWKNDIDEIPLDSKGPMSTTDKSGGGSETPIMPQAEVWEIWNLQDRCVYWFVKNYDKCLDCKEDPLELDQFFPDPPPMIANITSSKFIPKSDYAIAQDLYVAIDILEERLASLTAACKLVGVYDADQDDIKRLLNEGIENQLIPVKNWAMFAEKGGIDGVVIWLPIEAVVAVIEKLRAEQQIKIQQLYEITGMSDVVRGAQQQAYTSAAESNTKAQFASIQIQALQDEFARWASNLQNLKAEVIAKHYQPQSILDQSNIMMTDDADTAQAAVQFIKQDTAFRWRVAIRPESLALADYQQLKAERTEFMMAVSQFVQSMGPLVQMSPSFTPFLLQIMQWGMSGFKGSQQIEGVMDKAIKAFQDDAQQQKANPKPDPQDKIAQQKMQLAQQESQQKMQESAAESAQKLAADKQKQTFEFQRAAADHEAYMQKMQNDQQLEQQKFDNQMELLKAELIVNLAKLSAQQSADVSNKATDMIQHAEQTSMQARTDAAVLTHGAKTDMAVKEHETQQNKEQADHAAKVQVQSDDQGNGGGD